MSMLRHTLMSFGLALAAGLPVGAAHANCMSYGHSTIDYHETICYAPTMKQYLCTRRGKNWGLVYNTRLSLRSDLQDESICTYVDRSNGGPPVTSLLSNNAHDERVMASLKTPSSERTAARQDPPAPSTNDGSKL